MTASVFRQISEQKVGSVSSMVQGAIAKLGPQVLPQRCRNRGVGHAGGIDGQCAGAVGSWRRRFTRENVVPFMQESNSGLQVND